MLRDVYKVDHQTQSNIYPWDQFLAGFHSEVVSVAIHTPKSSDVCVK